MNTNFDHEFEAKRLDMLKHQFFSNIDVSGEIFFVVLMMIIVLIQRNLFLMTKSAHTLVLLDFTTL